ncbi:membrane protein [Litchfieldella qijiaojingensis]|uniref:Membrane protein n=1 Tax=Litchfieldella qijiaojingensis TaxID=980347 RepID=A0ABQ2YHR3_9GAMM|nr:DUF423 domain-containing protein [Halomonas qijiaojingensis]GGX84739.1 membrane protein [Halomonas qijiaojingensis]
MPHRLAWIAVALSGFVTVVAGAFGTHGLEGRTPPELVRAFETAVRYQAWHTLACLGILVWQQVREVKGQYLVLGLWAAGMLLFSGSLYLLVLTGARVLGPVTPVGGVLLMLGWLALAWCAWRAQSLSGKA